MSLRSAVIIIATAFALLTVGCVSKSSFEMMENEAGRLSGELDDLQSRYDRLKDARDELQKEKEALELEKSAVIADNKQLNLILEARSDSLSEVIANLRRQLADRTAECESAIDGLKKRLDEMNEQNIELRREITELEREKEEKVREVSSTYEELLKMMENEIEQGQIRVSELKGKLTVNMVDAILFESGEAKVKDAGMTVLQKVVDILKNVTDKNIRIEGHTDNVKIIGALARKFPTNWELSATRAVNVTRFLQEKGINPENLAAVAYGEYQPIADNDTPEGRVLNRRIEIILVAKER
ncbi:MAG: OmpA family protein [Desulfobulbales bacterium]|nr:OmpA family protein [Desulfobulbales bacterium]